MRETEILAEQQLPQGVLVCDHAGLVINNFSLSQVPGHLQPESAPARVQPAEKGGERLTRGEPARDGLSGGARPCVLRSPST